MALYNISNLPTHGMLIRTRHCRKRQQVTSSYARPRIHCGVVHITRTDHAPKTPLAFGAS